MKVTGIQRTIIDMKKKVNLEVLQNKEKILNRLVSNLADATPVDTGEARDGWHREGNSIVNNVEHIAQLNRGSSQQAPANFIERVILSDPNVTAKGQVVSYK